MRFTSGNWKLALTGNQAILDSGPLPALPPGLAISPYLAERLASLSPELLAAELGNVLDEPRRAALLQRRDALLAAAGR
jgi:hypothetical protein